MSKVLVKNVVRLLPYTVCGSSVAATTTHYKLTACHQTFVKKDNERKSNNNNNNGNVLCNVFSGLSITPLEAQLSAEVLMASCTTLQMSSHHNPQLRLPSLVQPVKITVPSLYSNKVLEMDLPSPFLDILDKVEPLNQQQQQHIIETPSTEVIEKQAARLIGIRRKKMKKHKLKKLRKKMKFVWAKTRQRREYKKEKLFQAEEMAKIKEFGAFNAEEYVSEFLRQINNMPQPGTRTKRQYPKHY
ncbi:hypothetical protein Pmani_017123 [Petrolisthes manimaculis]|uniref:Small ribosomal subunit protein mS38 n=1 Tax=Petrolisthes manimaculis TaxID=1843537 RepID=A0AAE1UA85_9EUCA|nr:hypothetical protein Pmani_017123 [Petrolisthes manimaculis]